MIFRVESGLFYFNVEYVREVVMERVRELAVTPRLVVLDLSASPWVDLQSAVSLQGLAEELAASGIEMKIVETRASVRDRLRALGLEEKVGGIDRFRTVAQVIEDFEALGVSPPSAPLR
jgi:MFS superfamily sulfate permease-like transporter